MESQIYVYLKEYMNGIFYFKFYLHFPDFCEIRLRYSLNLNIAIATLELSIVMYSHDVELFGGWGS